MSFEINGETWQPQSSLEHATNIVEKINILLQENNILDSNGNVVQLQQNYGNALYLLALGDGHKFAENDIKLSAAINSFNIELCDDKQIENLLPIAAITRNQGSYSTLMLTVTATPEGNCVIPAGTLAPYGDVNFVVPNEVIVSAGTSQLVNTVCDTLGPVAVLSGEITSFDVQIANLESVVNSTSSVPGVAPETTNQLRQRLTAGDTIKYTLDGCKGALEELTGINYARIYFNYNTDTTLTLQGGVVLQPRTAYIVIDGDSDKIAQTYATYMSAPTQNSPIATGTKSVVTVQVTASSDGSAIIPIGTTATYNGYTFETTEEVTIPANSVADVELTCTEIGQVVVPAFAISSFDETIENVSSVINENAAIPGQDDPKREQNWITASGQSIPIYYDKAQNKTVFVKVVLKENAENDTQIENQIKRDLIIASANWQIGEEVTQILTSAPFVNCSYTDVAYTLVSENGLTWSNIIDVGCNVIPWVSDTTISVEQIGE